MKTPDYHDQHSPRSVDHQSDELDEFDSFSDSDQLPIKHVMMMGRRSLIPPEQGEPSQFLGEAEQTEGSETAEDQNVLAIGHDDQSKDELIKKLQEQIRQMATVIATMNVQAVESPQVPNPLESQIRFNGAPEERHLPEVRTNTVPTVAFPNAHPSLNTSTVSLTSEQIRSNLGVEMELTVICACQSISDTLKRVNYSRLPRQSAKCRFRYGSADFHH